MVAGGSSATARSSRAARSSRPRRERPRAGQQSGAGSLEEVGRGGERRQRAGERPKVPGVALPQREPGEEPLHVGHRPEGFHDPLPEHRAAGQGPDRVEPGVDGGHVRERVAQPLGQAPAAGPGDGPVEQAEEGALALASGQRALDLQIGPGALVEEQHVGGGEERDAVDVAWLGALGLRQVVKGAAGGGDGPGEVSDAEAVEPGHAQLAGELLAGALEGGVVNLGDRDADRPRDLGGPWRRRHRPGHDQLPDARLAELLPEPGVGLHLAAAQLPRRGVEERQAPTGALRIERDRSEEARLPRVEGLLVEDRARGDDPGHVALHDPALPRRLDLVADGHLEAALEELRHVAARRVVRDAAHGDLPVPLGARRQRDLERLGGHHGVLREHLVEVAQPEEEDGVRVPRLHLEVLPHHRRRRLCDLGHGELLARRSASRSPGASSRRVAGLRDAL